MIASIDTSALLRIVLREAGALDDLRSCDGLVSSELIVVESMLARSIGRASEPMPMPLGTLDAMHLATALIWRDRVGPLPAIATHDGVLGTAALAFGFDVLGV